MTQDYKIEWHGTGPTHTGSTGGNHMRNQSIPLFGMPIPNEVLYRNVGRSQLFYVQMIRATYDTEKVVLERPACASLLNLAQAMRMPHTQQTSNVASPVMLKVGFSEQGDSLTVLSLTSKVRLMSLVMANSSRAERRTSPPPWTVPPLMATL